MNEFDYLEQAKEKMEDEKFQEAIELCNKALKINKELLGAYQIRSDANYNLENYNDAYIDQTKLINFEPDESTHYFDRSLTNKFLNNDEEAILDITRAIDMGMKFASCYSVKGVIEYGLGRFKEAIYDLTKSIEIGDINIVYVLKYRALCYEKTEEYDLAFADYNYALEIDPEAGYIYFLRGALKRELGNYKGAIKDLERAIEIDPNDDYSYLEIGKCRAEMGKKTAMKYINKAIKINPCADYYRKRIIAREMIVNMHKNVINLYRNVPVEDTGSNSTIKILNEKQAKEDIQDFTKILKLEPDDDIALLNRAQRYCYFKEYDKALDDYNSLIELAPENADYFRYRADVKYHLNMISEFLDDYEKSLELEKSH